MVSEPPFLWPPIKRYSRFFFGASSSGRPFSADRTVNAVFPLFLWRSFRRPPISGQPRRQFLRQLLPEPIVLPPTPISAKRTTKIGVSAPDRWICAISAYSGVAHALRSSPNDRSDAPSPDPKRSPSSKLPRAYTRLQKDLPVCQRASRAAMVIHVLPRAGTVFPRAGTHRQHLPRAPTRFGTISRGFRVPRAYWCVSCTRFLQPQALRVHHTCQAFFPGHALTSA
jgi:hypothetical protein